MTQYVIEADRMPLKQQKDGKRDGSVFANLVSLFGNRYVAPVIFGATIVMVTVLLIATLTPVTFSSQKAFAQGLCDPKENDCWYPGEGWEQGDWFTYEMCTFELR